MAGAPGRLFVILKKKDKKAQGVGFEKESEDSATQRQALFKNTPKNLKKLNCLAVLCFFGTLDFWSHPSWPEGPWFINFLKLSQNFTKREQTNL